MTIYLSETGGPKTVVVTFAYGGLMPKTHMCLQRDISRAAIVMGMVRLRDAQLAEGLDPGKHARELECWELIELPANEDALIQRTRNNAATMFLEHERTRDFEVLIMVDHDITWDGSSKGYEGDLCHLARLAVEHRSIVGAIISKKTQGHGPACLFKPGTPPYVLGSVGLVECEYMGSGMTAYHRDVLQAVADTQEKVHPGYYPLFNCLTVPRPDGLTFAEPLIDLSEDWSFCRRAADLGFRSWAATRPVTGHIGHHEFTIIGDSQKVNVRAEAELSKALKEFVDTAGVLAVLKERVGQVEWDKLRAELPFDPDELLANAEARKVAGPPGAVDDEPDAPGGV